MGVAAPTRELDAVVIGAGFSGLYLNHKLRDVLGLDVAVIEAGTDVGGTWYWNRYPGARCDSESYMYCFAFDRDLMQEWEWSGKYPEQPEILRYLNHVADRFDLRTNMRFETRVTAAHFDEAANRWDVETDRGERLRCQFLITAIGCLSTGQIPEFPGRDSFAGEAFHTGSWPHEGVDFTGKRVAVIGTGSSGVQSIPVIARQAGHLFVFQRTPQYMIPARHATVDKSVLDEIKADYDAIYDKARWSLGGFPYDITDRSAKSVTENERQAIFEEGWKAGGFKFVFGSFSDLRTDLEANEYAAEFIRSKIRETVKDPEVAEKLVPLDHPFGSKRTLIDTDYFETYNRDNVTLVDIRSAPIVEITPSGITTEDGHYEVDIIVYATGFDAMTGSFDRIDIRGRGGERLKDHWAAGPHTYLGLTVHGFPNMFMITGPGSPSVLSNMPVAIEQHVDLVADTIAHLRDNDLELIEADADAEAAWVSHVNELAKPTMFMRANSWYLGANIPGKPRVFMPYAGGVGTYRAHCNQVVADGYQGFTLTPAEVPAATG
ncbi:MAG: NAD(P)/FAD-dependent oxidoreductase [Acidimicrobiia bacterium]|nr:NAD(P)/FAD-dependent oxidoreductase [Acidimicrobiia bacterium]